MFDKKEFIVLKNGIDIEKFKYNEKDRLSIRNELNITNKKVIGHVGRFAYPKNHKFLLDVFKEISLIDENAVLVLVGTGELEQNIKNYAKSINLQNKVIYTGVRKDVNKMMSAFDCFILPSIYEGLGIVTIEAQTNGLRCYLSNNVPQEVNVTKNVSYLSLEQSPVEWASTIVNDSLYINREVAYEVVGNSGYDIKDCTKQLLDIYLYSNKKEERF